MGAGVNVERASSPSIQCFRIEAEVLESLNQGEGNSWVLVASELSLFWRVGNSRRRLKGLLPGTGQSLGGELGANHTGPCPCASNSPFCCRPLSRWRPDIWWRPDIRHPPAFPLHSFCPLQVFVSSGPGDTPSSSLPWETKAGEHPSPPLSFSPSQAPY